MVLSSLLGRDDSSLNRAIEDECGSHRWANPVDYLNGNNFEAVHPLSYGEHSAILIRLPDLHSGCTNCSSTKAAYTISVKR
jgi:hypothetical protein